MQYRLRTLLIVLALGPMVLAGIVRAAVWLAANPHAIVGFMGILAYLGCFAIVPIVQFLRASGVDPPTKPMLRFTDRELPWWAMGPFGLLFGERQSDQPMYGKRRYGYPSGNFELVIRHEQGGENLMAVLAQVQAQWKPGNEHLWDEYDPESLVDDEERRGYAVNQLLYSRLTLYRALRAAGRDVRGRDPFEFVQEVPKTLARLRERFPETLGRA